MAGGVHPAWGLGLGQAVSRQTSHCARTSVSLMPHKLERKEQPGMLGIVGAGAVSFAALAIQGHPYLDMPTGPMLGPPHPTVSSSIK